MAIYNLGGGGGQPELQTKTATPLITNAQQIIVPDDGYDGLSQVTVNPMPTGALKTPTVNSIGYVSSGIQTAGFLDTSATTGLQLSTQAAKTITPTTYSQTAVAKGKYTTGDITVKGDSNLVASNIKSGVSIFGVNGSLISNNTIVLNKYSWGNITIGQPSIDFSFDAQIYGGSVENILFVQLVIYGGLVSAIGLRFIGAVGCQISPGYLRNAVELSSSRWTVNDCVFCIGDGEQMFSIVRGGLTINKSDTYVRVEGPSDLFFSQGLNYQLILIKAS